MRVAEAEKAIVHEWRSWCLREGKRESGASGFEGLMFYSYVSQHRPELLRFRSNGDKWQRVHSWLLNSGSVED